MRWLVWCALLAACSSEAADAVDGGTVGADGAPAADAAMAPDARRIDAGGSGPDANLPPSTANVGWIGGACDGAGDCAFSGSICLEDGFPNGMCTRECDGLCPDRSQPGDTVTTCVDGRPFGFDEGLCVSRCDKTVLPPTGCPAGYRCLPKTRYLQSGFVIEVCVPAPPAPACGDADETIDVNYPDDGKLWIPGEAGCGGAFPLVVMMHGINPSKNTTPSLGGGRRLEYEVRSLIDSGSIVPVILAEPVHTDDGAASSTHLYDPDSYEPAVHLGKLKTLLDARGITISSVSFIGHSGAGCDPNNGLYLVLKRFAAIVPAFAPSMRMWGLEDVCYVGSYHYTAPMTALTGKGTVIFNVWSGQNDPTAFENGLLPSPVQLTPCPSSLYSKCIRHATQPWCSYRTAGASGVAHDDNPFFFVREAFPQVFPKDPGVEACR